MSVEKWLDQDADSTLRGGRQHRSRVSRSAKLGNLLDLLRDHLRQGETELVRDQSVRIGATWGIFFKRFAVTSSVQGCEVTLNVARS